jgi:prepilin-type N-terminal cleavage/methylation domain-containing protein
MSPYGGAGHRDRGMTIVEVLVATLVIGVVALVIFASFSIGLRAAALASGLNTATGLAEETLTRLTASPCGASFRLSLPPEFEDPRLARYRREVQVRPAGPPRLWELSVTVSWTQERQARSVTLTTLRHVSAACDFVNP